jgi:hypothetical protein
MQMKHCPTNRLSKAGATYRLIVNNVILPSIDIKPF